MVIRTQAIFQVITVEKHTHTRKWLYRIRIEQEENRLIKDNRKQKYFDISYNPKVHKEMTEADMFQLSMEE
jgi:predicted transcriptional regulator